MVMPRACALHALAAAGRNSKARRAGKLARRRARSSAATIAGPTVTCALLCLTPNMFKNSKILNIDIVFIT